MEVVVRDLIQQLKDEGFVRNNSELAAIIGVSAKTISDWTTGRYEPSLDKIKKLSEELNIKILIDDKKVGILGDVRQSPKTKEILGKVVGTNRTLAGANDKLADTATVLSKANLNLSSTTKEISNTSKNISKSNINLSTGIKDSILTSKILTENLKSMLGAGV